MKRSISLRTYFDEQFSIIGGAFRGEFVLFNRRAVTDRRFLEDSLDDVMLSSELLLDINFLFNPHSDRGQRTNLRSGDVYTSNCLGYLALLGTGSNERYLLVRMSLFDRGDIVSLDDAEHLCQMSGLRSRGKLRRIGYMQ